MLSLVLLKYTVHTSPITKDKLNLEICLGSYLEKLLLVHVLVAVNVEHFESYVKSCARLCNSNVIVI